MRPFSSKRLLRRRADDAVGNFETENQVFLQKAQAVHQARVQEDDVWQKSQVDLMPSDALTALYTQLKGFERYAREYYLPKGKADDDPTPEPDPQPEPDVTPVEPEA